MELLSDKIHKEWGTKLEFWTSKEVRHVWDSVERTVFDSEVDTIELELRDGNHRIVVNPKFWRRTTGCNRAFILTHELLHLMFGHIIIPDGMDRSWTNIAQDIEVNEFIRANYPALVPNKKVRAGQAWLETVFKDKSDLVKKTQNYKYYYTLLMKCLE
jgi:hypothetical protein